MQRRVVLGREHVRELCDKGLAHFFLGTPGNLSFRIRSIARSDQQGAKKLFGGERIIEGAGERSLTPYPSPIRWARGTVGRGGRLRFLWVRGPRVQLIRLGV